MIKSNSIAELYNKEQREQLCKWCRETGRSDCSRCALTKTAPSGRRNRMDAAAESV